MNSSALYSRLEGITGGNGPITTLSFAQSLDGCIAPPCRGSIRLSGNGSSRLTHFLRSRHDAIIVGSGTVLTDDPRLTVRLVDGRDPRPAVLDSRLRTPLDSKILSREGAGPIIFCAPGFDGSKRTRLERAGAEICVVERDRAGALDLSLVLDRLRLGGMRKIMIEGGGMVINSVIRSSLPDLLVVTIAPRILRGLRAVEGMNLAMDPGRVPLRDFSYVRLAPDTILVGEFEDGFDEV